jgi:hypothetical protein
MIFCLIFGQLANQCVFAGDESSLIARKIPNIAWRLREFPNEPQPVSGKAICLATNQGFIAGEGDTTSPYGFDEFHQLLDDFQKNPQVDASKMYGDWEGVRQYAYYRDSVNHSLVQSDLHQYLVRLKN